MLSEEYKETGKLDPFDFGLGVIFVATLLGMFIYQCFGKTTSMNTYSAPITMISEVNHKHVNEIYDITGRCVNRDGDTTSLVSGFYFMRCDSVYKKIIVK
jgi:hypothetical protein